MSIINDFIETCKANGEKTAIIYKNRKISFSNLLSDIYRMMNLFDNNGIRRGEKYLLLCPPSYDFYVLIFAGLCYGINLVAMDSYRNMKNTENVILNNNINGIFCNNMTRFLKKRFNTRFKFVNVQGYTKYSENHIECDSDSNRIVLTTFTSGTTGQPKAIERCLNDFTEQIRVISTNIDVGSDDIVFSKLPVYVLFIIYKGFTCVIASRLKERILKKYGVTTVMAPIIDMLKLKNPISSIKKIYVGGAMLYEHDAVKLCNIFPNAKKVYIYGSSECVLMAKGEIEEYLNKSFALCPDIKGITLTIENKDKNQVGQICVKGNAVLSENKLYLSNDLGYIDDDGLHIVGRKLYSTEETYNYLKDIEILSQNPLVKKGFSFVYDKNLYFCYEGKITNKVNHDIIYIKFRHLPMDSKHRTKLNYNKAIEMMTKK